MSDLNHASPSLTPFQDAFERVLPELAALPEAEVLGINLDLPQAVTIALGALEDIAAHREAIATDLPTVDLAKLETYAHAAAHAHAHVLAASTVPPMKELFARAAHWRQLLCSDAMALARRGLLDERRLSALHGPNGHRRQVAKGSSKALYAHGIEWQALQSDAVQTQSSAGQGADAGRAPHDQGGRRVARVR